MRQHDLRPRHRKHRLVFGELAPPALIRDKIEDSLPVLHRGTRDTHVRQRSHQVRIDEALHVIPQQISHPAMLPGTPTQRTPVSLDQRHRGTPREKCLREFDYTANPNVGPGVINNLATCE